MKRVTVSDDWPASWKASYNYDAEEVYDQAMQLGYAYAYQNRRSRTLQLIREVLPAGASILDVAAAQGNFSLALAELGYRVTWNDLRAELADYVKLKHEFGEVSYAPGNVFDLDFREPFDCILATEIIEHVAHPDQFLERVSQLLRPGGYIVMTTPNGRYFKNRLPRFSDCANPEAFEAVQFRPNSDGHIFLLWPDEVHALGRRAGLDVEKMLLFTTPLTNGHVKLGAVLRALPKSLVFQLESMAAKLPKSIAERVMVHSAARFRKRAANSG
jgi:2-polyprenyl-6-hydroxyphenyl methylase/3-demethylubiquinone-9 3-methyltransferase